MQLQLNALPGCTVVAGKSGTGKTTFALRWLVARRDLTCRFLFQEPKRDIAQRLGLADAENADELACAVDDGFVIFYPGALFSGDWAAGLSWFCEWSYGVASRLPGRKLLMSTKFGSTAALTRYPGRSRNGSRTGDRLGARHSLPRSAQTSSTRQLPTRLPNSFASGCKAVMRWRASRSWALTARKWASCRLALLWR